MYIEIVFIIEKVYCIVIFLAKPWAIFSIGAAAQFTLMMCVETTNNTL
jgi:hypothetical protein